MMEYPLKPYLLPAEYEKTLQDMEEEIDLMRAKIEKLESEIKQHRL